MAEKHKETFWITADSKKEGNIELFKYKSITHTKMPFTSAFDSLVELGVITMDHLIKQTIEDGKMTVKEKGPLFKINEKDFSLLFPPSAKYIL